MDRVVPERPDAATEPETFCHRVAHAVAYELALLSRQPPADRYATRLARYREIGRP
ncbi:MAG: hypothetical protein ACRDTM_03270 [Micromonosporaceae bacterium]